jgi:hypothetical protein
MTTKKSSAVLMVLIAGVLVSGSAFAHTDGDVRGGVYSEVDRVAVGGGLLTSLDNASRWYFNPNVEVRLGDQSSRNDVSVNGDFHYDFPTDSSVSPYLGAGPAVLLDGSNSDIAANVVAGIAGKRGEVRPFGQIKGVMSRNNEVALMAGIRF